MSENEVKSAKEENLKNTELKDEGENRGLKKTSVLPSHEIQPSEETIQDDKKMNLPEKMPEAWLDQIKGKLKENTSKIIITTILGSSVLGTVFSAFANYHLEGRKTELAWKQLEAKNKLDTYISLSNDIQALETKVRAVLILSEVASKNQSKINIATEEISALTNQIATVQDRLNHPDFDGSEAKSKISTSLSPIGVSVESIQRSPSAENFKNLASILQKIKDTDLTTIKEAIKKDKEAITSILK